MLNEKALLEFAEPYYIDKDIMHNMWHIELVVLDKNKCYLPETIPLCEEMNKYTTSFFEELIKEIR